MSKFTLDVKDLEAAVDLALEAGAVLYQSGIIPLTPRDPDRPPNNPNAKVTGNLKRAIGYKKIWKFHYVVGVRGTGSLIEDRIEQLYTSGDDPGTPVEVYAYYQEFGTIRIPPRSFIRVGFYKFHKQANDEIKKAFKSVVR